MKNLTPSWTRITEKRGDNLKKAELNALAVRARDGRQPPQNRFKGCNPASLKIHPHRERKLYNDRIRKHYTARS